MCLTSFFLCFSILGHIYRVFASQDSKLWLFWPSVPRWEGVRTYQPSAKKESHLVASHAFPHSVQLLSRVRLFATPWTAAHQASLSITNSPSSPKPMSIELVMPSNHLILCRPLLLLPSIFPSIRVFSNESALRIRWAKVLEFQLQHQSFQWTPRSDLL